MSNRKIKKKRLKLLKIFLVMKQDISEKFLNKRLNFMDMILTKRTVLSSFFRKENLDEYRLKNILLDFLVFICYNKTIKRKEVKLK